MTAEAIQELRAEMDDHADAAKNTLAHRVRTANDRDYAVRFKSAIDLALAEVMDAYISWHRFNDALQVEVRDDLDSA